MPRKKVNVGQSESPRRRRWWLWAVVGFVGLVVLGALLPPVDDDPTLALPASGEGTDSTPISSPESGGGEQTPEPTVTPAPTVTPEPTLTLEERVREVIGREVESLVLNDWSMVVRYPMRDTFSYNVGRESDDMVQWVCRLREMLTGRSMRFDATINVSDGFGEISTQSGLTVSLEAETISRINCENVFGVRLADIADLYVVDRLLDE